ncbi:MAG: Smr/MutS family protein, partial [Bacteroidetes bacterium]|nr:Smr/MutS family protein [Bacteroidota bacterium]
NVDGLIRLVRARNPVLVLHFMQENETREVVPLDLELGEEAVTLIITGPNAGGKSVAMKTVGVLSIMAQCGIPIPADLGTSLPLFSRLFVDIGDRQSIQEDLSTFTSHLASIAQMLEEAEDRSLVLIDEAGTGTDPAEGGALAQAVLQRLTEQGARTIATTDHGALKAFAHAADGVENGSMQFDRKTLAPTYRFQRGIPGSSYAFEIAARVGLDRGVVKTARELVGEGKAALEDLIADFEQRTREAEGRRDEADAQLAEAERIRADFEQRLGRIRNDRERLKAEALEQAEQIVQDANAAVEKTIREIKEAEAEREATKAARKQLEAVRETISERRKKSVSQSRRAEKSDGVPEGLSDVSGPIQRGDQVRLEGSSAVGEVVELSETEAVIAFGSMTSRAKLERLMKVGGPQQQKVEDRAPRSSPSSPSITTTRTRIDVRGQRVEEAVPVIMRLVDEAVAASAPSVEILHGKGTGALRIAIREHLASRDDVASFESAPWNQGGDGVTLVVLH